MNWKVLLVALWSTMTLHGNAQTWHDVALKRQITHPQPMTGLADVASRGHQLVARFRYEYPSSLMPICRDQQALQLWRNSRRKH